jgi:hypothetical protein
VSTCSMIGILRVGCMAPHLGVEDCTASASVSEVAQRTEMVAYVEYHISVPVLAQQYYLTLKAPGC